MACPSAPSTTCSLFPHLTCRCSPISPSLFALLLSYFLTSFAASYIHEQFLVAWAFRHIPEYHAACSTASIEINGISPGLWSAARPRGPPPMPHSLPSWTSSSGATTTSSPGCQCANIGLQALRAQPQAIGRRPMAPPPPPVLALSPTSCPTKAHQIQYARPIYGRAAALAAKQVKTGRGSRCRA